MENTEIRHLLERIARKDKTAFDELFTLYYPKLIQIALTYVQEIVAAQEVVSDLFYKILRNPDTITKVRNFDNYIFFAVKNQSFTYLKKRKSQEVLQASGEYEDYFFTDHSNPESSLISDELYKIIAREVSKLPPKRKTVFLLVKEEGKKYREVAEILDISIKTVELQMSLALKTLRKAIKYYLDSKDVKIRQLKFQSKMLHIFGIFFC